MIRTNGRAESSVIRTLIVFFAPSAVIPLKSIWMLSFVLGRVNITAQAMTSERKKSPITPKIIFGRKWEKSFWLDSDIIKNEAQLANNISYKLTEILVWHRI
jgi:hypothetical protein